MAMATPRLVLGNRVNVSDSFDELVRYSGAQNTPTEINPDGTAFGNSIQFTNVVSPNLDNTMISRNWRVMYEVSIAYQKGANAPKFAGVNVSATGVHSLGVGNQVVDTTLRAYPLSSIADTIQLTINSSQLSYQSRLANDVIQRFFKKEINEYKSIECPTMPDNKYILSTDGFTGSTPLVIPNQPDWAAVVAAYGVNGIAFVINGVSCVYTPVGAAAPPVGTTLMLTVPGQPGNTAVAFCLVATAYAGGAASTLGNITLINGLANNSNQPLSRYSNSAIGATRASFRPIAVADEQPQAGYATVIFQVVEAVLSSPLSLQENESSLCRVNTASLLYTYSKLQTDFLSTANPNMTLGANGLITIQNPKLLLNYITVDQEIVKIPQSLTYPYESVVVYSNNKGGNAGLTSTTALQQANFNTDTIRLSNCPHRIYLVVRRQIVNRVSTQTTVPFGLGSVGVGNQFSGLKITYGNRTGLLSATSNFDLYRMASKNGYNGSFEEWSQAGIYAFDPVSDFGIDVRGGDALPLEGNAFTNIQISGNYNNYGLLATGQTFNDVPEVAMIVVYNGAISISVDNVVQSLALLTPNEMDAVLKKAPVDGTMVSDELIKPTIMGSGLFSSAKSLLGKAAKGLGSETGQKVLQYLGKL